MSAGRVSGGESDLSMSDVRGVMRKADEAREEIALALLEVCLLRRAQLDVKIAHARYAIMLAEREAEDATPRESESG